MNNGAEGEGMSNVIKYGAAVAVALLLVAAGSLWLIFAQNSNNHLLPALSTPTPAPISTPQEPEAVTFTKLNENPLDYLNKQILVTGEYLPIEQTACPKFVGPDIRWSLTAESLQLDVIGYEKIVRLLPVGTTMTVQGIWRFYQGPLGCGKGPAPGTRWYLDARKIVQPNPLVSAGGQAIPVEIRDNTLGFPQLIPTEPAVEIIPTAEIAAPTITADSTIAPSPTNPGQIIPTATVDAPDQFTPSPTAIQTPGAGSPTSSPDPNITPTFDPTAIPTIDPGNGTPTLTPETLPLPATATQTNGGGYPGPGGTPTPTPSATPDPYP